MAPESAAGAYGVTNIIETYSALKLHESNEAETRLKVIDRIIFEVLGWSHDDVSVEEHVTEDKKSTYADYIVRTANTALLIEAKKVGVEFSVVPNKRRAKLQGQLMEGATGEAIRQARDYCRKLGVPFAAVTNGSQWIVFPASRVDQVKFQDSPAIIFSSLESALEDDHGEFFGLLGRQSVISGGLAEELLGRTTDQLIERRLNSFYTSRTTQIQDNPLYPLIEPAVVTAFSDSIEENDEILRECYVQTPDRMKFDSQIKMHVQKRHIELKKRPKRPMKKAHSKALDEIIEKSEVAVRPAAILVLGTVGAGKTTFLNYTRKVSIPKFFEEDKGGPYPQWIKVDFRPFSKGDEVQEFLYESLHDYISKEHFLRDYEQCVRPAYRDEIDALRNGPLKPILRNEDLVQQKIAELLLEEFKDKKRHVDKVLRYAATKVPIFVVIDNIDQIEDQQTQGDVISEAFALAHRSRLNIVLAMRESSYARCRASPMFDAFDFEPIYIDPPQIEAVLSRRFHLVKRLLDGTTGEFFAENGAKVIVEDMSLVADLIQSSVLGTEIGRQIDVLATSDVRLALRMTREFLSSGYSSPGKAVQIYQQGGKYVLPRHEALRSILLGNQTTYSESLSVLGNPFDSRVGRTTAQLLRLYIISGLTNLRKSAEAELIDGIQLRDILANIGFGEDIALSVLGDVTRFRFVHTAAQDKPDFLASYYASRLGGFVVRGFMANLTFLENAMMDTFIADNEVWNELKELSETIKSAKSVVDRLRVRHKRIKCFWAYMHFLYRPLIEESQRRGLAWEWGVDPFEENQRRLDLDLERAMNSAERNYGANRPHIDRH